MSRDLPYKLRSGKRIDEILRTRELEFARLISEGYSNKGIAEMLGLSYTYTRQVICRLYERLGYGRVDDWRISHLEPRILVAVRYCQYRSSLELCCPPLRPPIAP